VRVVRTPDGRVVFDATGRLPGRGAYLCADGACWRLASTKHALDRALHVTLPPELEASLAAGIPERITIEGGPRGQE
jgi:predicted RNA-binding protein YlxR (DUF448 family)